MQHIDSAKEPVPGHEGGAVVRFLWRLPLGDTEQYLAWQKGRTAVGSVPMNGRLVLMSPGGQGLINTSLKHLGYAGGGKVLMSMMSVT